MKSYHPSYPQESFVCGSILTFSKREEKEISLITGTVLSNSKWTQDGEPYIEVGFNQKICKYITNWDMMKD
ncbi:hypothetical protein EEL30_21560 [Brevibacillus laterosporus]|uniref:Uncharacterized protein n=1 Tax=Brevibacillus laterosporus TaxID=1465 RepID=A0A518VCB5_BRELA|nr:hypothetical protein EEL30_21560 [Brevibacillus laterosporus]